MIIKAKNKKIDGSRIHKLKTTQYHKYLLIQLSFYFKSSCKFIISSMKTINMSEKKWRKKLKFMRHHKLDFDLSKVNILYFLIE